MSTPASEIDNRFARRKLEAELGRFFTRMASITAGLRGSVASLPATREAVHPGSDASALESRSARDLAALLIEKLEGSGSVEEQAPALRFLARVRDLSAVADDLARGIFATGLLCDDARNVLYRSQPGRAKEYDLSLERIRTIAEEADQIERSLVALVFSIRSNRSFEQAFRMIHPGLAIRARDSGRKEV